MPFLLSSAFLHADDAPVIPTQSGTMRPVYEEFIQLVSQEINIYLERDTYRVEVDYVFRNTGGNTSITMGFPNETDWMYGRSIEGFKAWVDGTSQEIYRKEYRVTSKPYGPGSAPDYYFECFDTSFDAGQTRSVRNEYSQEYITDYDMSFLGATYILTTGAYWRDSIEEITVRIHTPGRIQDYSARSVFFEGDDLDGPGYLYEGLSISPEPTGSFDGGLEIILEDIEPDFDIEISMPPPVIAAAYSETELIDSRYSYGAENVFDDDPATSWVEGAPGAGIGESIELLLSAWTAGGKLEGSYEIAEIAMINGYAASESLYYANNRPKRVRVDYRNAAGGPDSGGSFVWDLRETTDLQVLPFRRPILMGSLSITIESVYPGSRYDDTCIAEIVVTPAAPR